MYFFFLFFCHSCAGGNPTIIRTLSLGIPACAEITGAEKILTKFALSINNRYFCIVLSGKSAVCSRAHSNLMYNRKKYFDYLAG
jgi:hypothetical protein